MKILFKLATKSRPQRFFEALESIINNITSDDYLVAVTADANDPTMFNPEVTTRCSQYKNVEILFGSSVSKIDAINRDLPLYPGWDILVNFSDDMKFITKGFGENIRTNMQNFFPDLDGVLHYRDENNGDRLMTMSIMGKKYFDRFGYIYHPSYVSLWSDNEAMVVAKLLKKYKFINKTIFKHNHPAIDVNFMDDQYRHTESFFFIDGENFKLREAKKFDL